VCAVRSQYRPTSDKLQATLQLGQPPLPHLLQPRLLPPVVQRMVHQRCVGAIVALLHLCEGHVGLQRHI